MPAITQTKVIKEFRARNLGLFTVSDFKKLFSIKKNNTAYKAIERLTSKGIFKRLTKKRYLFTLAEVDDYQIANFLYSPSYISLETALCFYGIVSQFPYQITSITLKRAKTIEALNKEFAYFQAKRPLFFGYEQKDKFLIALPEKAFLDYLYFCSKGLREFEIDEWDINKINKKVLLDLLHKAGAKNLNKFLIKAGIC